MPRDTLQPCLIYTCVVYPAALIGCIRAAFLSCCRQRFPGLAVVQIGVSGELLFHP
jgi:hypothetical protein